MRSIVVGVTLIALVGCRKDLTREDLDGDGVSAADGDCGPGDEATFPDAPEVCDGRDNNCDGVVDEGVGTPWYSDEDGDGFGTAEVIACDAPAATTSRGGDCDDENPQVNPAAREACSDVLDFDCDGSPGGVDGDGDGVVACEDCDDEDKGVFQGAPERCNANDDDCDGEVDEDATDASTYYADLDDDGFGSDRFTVVACEAPVGFVNTADDCDDLHAASHPGATEDCDALDNDCNDIIDDGATGTSTWYADADKDGFGDKVASEDTCGQPVGYVANADDCDDADAKFNPSATETCLDPNDYNCDGSVGQADGDGDGTPACSDCDDNDSTVEPNAPEICDGTDNDCDAAIDETAPTWYADVDGDGHGGDQLTVASCIAPGGFVASSDDCDDLAATAHPGATEECNGQDDDCAGGTPANEADADSDRWRACEGDCADTDATAFPGALEVCDAKDNDCDSVVDDSAVDARTWFKDADGDGVGSTAVVACTQPAGTSAVPGDCNDTSKAISPLADELCATAGIDDDCDGAVDEASLDGKAFYRDTDGDGHGVSGQFVIACESLTGYAAIGDDCDDTDNKTFPGATEIPSDTVDRNCDGHLGGVGLDASNPGQSCRHVKLANPLAASGVFWLGGLVPSFQAYCDMTVAGGTGWTRVLSYVNSDPTSLRTDTAVGAPGVTSANHKLSSAQVNSIVGTAPYVSLAYRGASTEYYRWDGTTRVFNWTTLNTTDAWADSACSTGAALYRSTDGNTFLPHNIGPAWALLSVCPNTFNKGGYFHFSDAGTYRIRAFIKNESEPSGYDFNNQRDSTSMWYVQPAVIVGTTTAPAGVSCNAIKAGGASQGDGQYVIQPGGQPATTVWCDMTSDPLAGWTLVAKYVNGGPSNGVSLLAGADNVANMTTPAVSGKAKFADAFVNAIPWTSYKIDSVGDSQRQVRCDTKFSVQWDAAQGVVGGTLNGHNLQWCYGAVPTSGVQCMTMLNTNTFGVSPHEAGLGGHWIHTPAGPTLGGFSCGYNNAAENACSRISDYFVVRHWVK